jgi:hypothetical protein
MHWLLALFSSLPVGFGPCACALLFKGPVQGDYRGRWLHCLPYRLFPGLVQAQDRLRLFHLVEIPGMLTLRQPLLRPVAPRA